MLLCIILLYFSFVTSHPKVICLPLLLLFLFFLERFIISFSFLLLPAFNVCLVQWGLGFSLDPSQKNLSRKLLTPRKDFLSYVAGKNCLSGGLHSPFRFLLQKLWESEDQDWCCKNLRFVQLGTNLLRQTVRGHERVGLELQPYSSKPVRFESVLHAGVPL